MSEGSVHDAVGWARDLVNTPAGDLPPAEIAKSAKAMAKEVGLTCTIWNETQLAQGGFGVIVRMGGPKRDRFAELVFEGSVMVRRQGEGLSVRAGDVEVRPAGDGVEVRVRRR